METVGDRLREERTRLGLNQEEFAAVGGLRKQAELNYESGARSPDADYLLALESAGVDIVYVLTGRRVLTDSAAVVLNNDEQEILRKYRQLNEAGKGAVEALINGCLFAGVFTKSGKATKHVRGLSPDRAAAMNAETEQQAHRALQEDAPQRLPAKARTAKRGH
jgi:transcriptional regulator with XRE-family HTH domain